MIQTRTFEIRRSCELIILNNVDEMIRWLLLSHHTDRIALLPGERRYQQSSIQRKTCNPLYNEVFGFCVSWWHAPSVVWQSVITSARITVGFLAIDGYERKDCRLNEWKFRDRCLTRNWRIKQWKSRSSIMDAHANASPLVICSAL
jgi:hypothetical protein